jgi:hypothetical protein
MARDEYKTTASTYTVGGRQLQRPVPKEAKMNISTHRIMVV